MDNIPFRKPLRRYLLPVLAGGILVGHLALLWGWTIEDVFILYRWARNIAQGLGFVFNPGERIEGYSNFFYLVILAVLHKIGIPAPSISSLLGLVSSAGVFLLLLVTLARYPAINTRRHYLGLFFLSLSPSFCLYAVSGLETVPYAFLVLASLQLFYGEFSGRISYPLSWIITVPAILCRPEAPMILVADGMSLAIWWLFLSGQGKRLLGRWFSFQRDLDRDEWMRMLSPKGAVNFRIPAISLSISLVALIIYFVWKVNYFGNILPNTFYLKATGRPILQWAVGVKYSLLFLLFECNISVLILLLPLVRLRDHLYVLPHLLILIGYGFFNVLCGGDWMPLCRFYVPVIPSMVLLISSGFSVMASGTRRRAQALTALLCLSLVIKLGLELFAKVDKDYTMRDIMTQVRAQAHTRCFYEMGVWMRDNLPPTTVFASAEAGIIPYLTNFYYVDMKGYIDTHIAHLDCPIPIWCKYDNEYILSRRPDCIIVNILKNKRGPMQGLFPWDQDLLEKPTFQSEYRLIHTVKRGVEPYRVSQLCLFCRHDVP